MRTDSRRSNRPGMMPCGSARLSGFPWSDGELFCEGVPLRELAKEFGTPLYVYSKAAILNRVERLRMALNGATPGDASPLSCKIHFSVKSCPNTHILGLLGRAGCGADIVSGGELFRASIAGVPAADIIFSGVGKTKKEITEALKARIGIFNVESTAELETLNRLAGALGARPRIALRINPDVDAKTHPHIATGLKKNKFGLSKLELKEVYRLLPRLTHLDPYGLSCHIGSQILSKQPFVKAWTELAGIARRAPFDVRHLDLGGGLGIPYKAADREFPLEEYGRLIQEIFGGKGFELSVEPGRAIVGPTAVLLSTVTNVKKRGATRFFILDTGMNDLIRPALYGAAHPVLCVVPPRSRQRVKADLVGPICESADTFFEGIPMPPLESGALLAFTNAGAYGMSMASQYNSRPRAAEVLIDGTQTSLIRSRESYADLVQHELL